MRATAVPGPGVYNLARASGGQTGSQVAFGAVGVLAVAALTRTGQVDTVSRVIAAIVIMSVFSTAFKQASSGALMIGHAHDNISAADTRLLMERAAAVGGLGLAVGFVLLWTAGHSAALGVRCWIGGSASCDLLRLAAVTYGNARLSSVGVVLHLSSGIAAVPLGRGSVAMAAGWFARPQLLGAFVYVLAMRDGANPNISSFLKQHSGLSRTVEVEDTALAVLSSATPLIRTARQPAVAVYYQIANQSVASPAAYLATVHSNSPVKHNFRRHHAT